jgi:NhaP-type Na+/H+ or K+/H+ antiporter
MWWKIYWVVAVLFSLYNAYRGYMGNWFAWAQKNEAITRKFKRWEMHAVFHVHDALFHFICSMAGFITLAVAINLYESLVSAESFDTGKSVLLVSAFLFGIVGITGQLPTLIPQGKLFGVKP